MSKHGFKQLSVDNWREPDPMLEIFVRLSRTGELRRPSADERAREFLTPALHERVPEAVRRLFEVARGALLYGHFFYPLYTLGAEQLFRVAEAAITHKCNEVGAPRSVTKSFERRLRYLVEAGAIPPGAETAWDATRHLRNLASHPQAQSILPPGNVAGILYEIVEQINALFNDQETLEQFRVEVNDAAVRE